MSSILDALRKLEDERAAAKNAVEVELDAEVAERELVGRRGRHGTTIPLGPAGIVLAGLGLTTLLIAVVLAASFLIVRSCAQSVLSSSLTGTQETMSAHVVPDGTGVIAGQTALEPAEGGNAHPPAQSDPAALHQGSERNVATQGAPSSRGNPGAFENPPRYAEAGSNADGPPDWTQYDRVFSEEPWPGAMPPATRPKRTPAAPLVRKSMAPVDWDALPILSGTARDRHGLLDLKLNMPQPQTEYRPRASAIFNLNKVWEGDVIPNTEAFLIGVQERGVAIEIATSGERYFIPF